MNLKTYAKGVNVVVDTLWGDSGKGKIVDMAAQHVDMVVRYAGGSNAGHTIKNEKGIFKLHLVPSGILNPKVMCIIDSGVVIDPISLALEIADVQKQGVSITPKNLRIAGRAHLVMPWHLLRDQPKKSKSTSAKIGTTGRGIGPTYSDKTAREGLRVKDLFTPDFSTKIEEELKKQNKILSSLYGVKPLNKKQVLLSLKKARSILKPFVDETFPIIQEYKRKKKNILGEGAQGALLDIDLGGFPYVTSSHTGVTGFSTSTGIHDHEIVNVIGVTKAYATRVGGGPMPTELLDKNGEKLREVGGEYGATTGRPRRCGWFDLPATKYGILISGTRSIALMKLDVLDVFKTIKVCVAYRLNGKTVAIPPDMDANTLVDVKPVYESFKGWEQKTTEIRSFDKLPTNAKKYIQFLEKQLGSPVQIISVGAGRDQTLFKF